MASRSARMVTFGSRTRGGPDRADYPLGVITEFSVGISPGSLPVGITAGPDRNLWFTEFDGNRIATITRLEP